jgi:hypothetical protein
MPSGWIAAWVVVGCPQLEGGDARGVRQRDFECGMTDGGKIQVYEFAVRRLGVAVHDLLRKLAGRRSTTGVLDERNWQ